MESGVLYIPRQGLSLLEDNQGTTAAEYGTSVAGPVATHTKNTTYTTLIASLARTAYGIIVGVHNTSAANTATSVLVDIAIGAAAAEQVIIPNLIAGYQSPSSNTGKGGSWYFFPITIAAGVRLSATLQSQIASDTCHVQVYLLGGPVPGRWYGQRVTAYGVASGSSDGTSHSPGNSAYATATNLTASTTNPIKALQVGIGGLGDGATSTSRGLVRLLAAATTIADDLPWLESTGIEDIQFTGANFILSQMAFNIPAGVALAVQAMRNVAAEARGFIAYGVD